MLTALTKALKARGGSFDSVASFWSAHMDANGALELPVDRAIAGGALADRLGYAFAAGYAAALQALLPALGSRTLASVAATEEGGAHPRAIKTQLVREAGSLRLRGHKRWVTLAGDELLVLANAGQRADGMAELKVVRVRRSKTGVRIVEQPPAPFIPEILHAEVQLEDVQVAETDVLEGDGWNRWIRPFRTIEDIHVHAALLGHLVARPWPEVVREKMCGVLVALRSLAVEDASAPETHLALAGCIEQTRALVAELDWSSADASVRERWERDSPLLLVASKARAARRQKAWESLGQ